MRKNRKSEIKTLEKFSLENRLLIVDTSIIIGPLGQKRNGLRLKEQIDFTEKNKDFLIEIEEYLENGSRFYTTELILKEIYEGCRCKKSLDPYGLIEDEGKERERLAESFRDNKKIIILDGNKKDLYDCISKKYKGIGKERGLSYADFDLLMKGLTIAITSNPVDLLSNDYPIFFARNDILQEINSKRRKIYNKNFGDDDIGFFNRIGFSEFERLVMKQSYKDRNSAVIPK